MKTTRREFIGAAAGVVGSVALGGIEFGREAGAADSVPGRLIKYHGLRPTDPGGRLGLRNSERGWRFPLDRLGMALASDRTYMMSRIDACPCGAPSPARSGGPAIADTADRWQPTALGTC